MLDDRTKGGDIDLLIKILYKRIGSLFPIHKADVVSPAILDDNQSRAKIRH